MISRQIRLFLSTFNRTGGIKIPFVLFLLSSPTPNQASIIPKKGDSSFQNICNNSSETPITINQPHTPIRPTQSIHLIPLIPSHKHANTQIPPMQTSPSLLMQSQRIPSSLSLLMHITPNRSDPHAAYPMASRPSPRTFQERLTGPTGMHGDAHRRDGLVHMDFWDLGRNPSSRCIGKVFA